MASLAGAASADTREGGRTQGHAQMAGGGFGTLVAPEHILDDFTPEQPVLHFVTPSAPAGETIGLRSNQTVQAATTTQNAADDYKAAPGCQIQCITSGIAYARGVDAELVVKTDTAARIWVTVWNNDGYNRMIESGPGSEVMQFAAYFDDLDPHTFYYAEAAAMDGQGYIAGADGSFETLTRNVEVSFNSASLIDTPFGNDAFTFGVWANGEWLETTAQGPFEPSGNVLGLGFNSYDLKDVPDLLSFAVLLAQRDASEDFCQAFDFPTSPSNGQQSCDVWSTAKNPGALNVLDHRPVGATSWTEHDLQWELILADDHFGLDFTVDINLHVYYD
jgi:hypothetical protein